MAAQARAAETHVGNGNFQKDVIEVQALFQQKFQNFHEGALHSLPCACGIQKLVKRCNSACLTSRKEASWHRFGP